MTGRGRTSCRARLSAITASALGCPGGQARALERIDGDVDLGRRAVADRLAVVEHRRLVLLALADDDDAVHGDRVEHVAHGVDGGLVGGLLVAAADEPAAASAAASVTRTSSSARLRSGRVGRASGIGLRAPGGLRARSVPDDRTGGRRRHQRPSRAGENHAVLQAMAAGGRRLVDDRRVDDQAEGDDRDDRRHLAARPRELWSRRMTRRGSTARRRRRAAASA